MSTTAEADGIRELLSTVLSEADVFAILKTTTGGIVPKGTKEDAITSILLYSDAVTILNRQRVKKEYLGAYLHRKNIPFNPKSATKTELCQTILKHWQWTADNVKAIAFPDSAGLKVRTNSSSIKESESKLPLVYSSTAVSSSSSTSADKNADLDNKKDVKKGILKYTVPIKDGKCATTTVSSSTLSQAPSGTTTTTAPTSTSEERKLLVKPLAAAKCTSISPSEDRKNAKPLVATSSTSISKPLASTTSTSTSKEPVKPSSVISDDDKKEQSITDRKLEKPEDDGKRNSSIVLVTEQNSSTSVVETGQCKCKLSTIITVPPSNSSSSTSNVDDNDAVNGKKCLNENSSEKRVPCNIVQLIGAGPTAEDEVMNIDLHEYLALRQTERQVGQQLGEAFAQWYFTQVNTMDGFVKDHFWPECNLRIEYISSNALEKQEVKEILHSGPKCFEAIANIRTTKGLYFNPNIPVGIRGKMNPHGLCQVISVGTFHNTSSASIIGSFEQIFGLMRDPFASNNFKIKFSLLRMRENSYLLKDSFPKSICDSTLAGTIDEDTVQVDDYDSDIGVD